MTREEVINIVKNKLGTSKEPVSGPSYILPDGSFLLIWDSKTPIQGLGGASKSGRAMHLDVDGWLLRNIDDIDNFENYYLNKDCIRVNTGFEEYIVLSTERPTEAQYKSLLAWLDEYISSYMHDKITVIPEKNKIRDGVTYTFDKVLADDIIKNIKRYYTTGKLVEEKTLQNSSDHVIINEMVGKNNISDQRVKKLIYDCINDMKKLNYTGSSFDKGIVTFDDIDFKEGDTLHRFGEFQWPKNSPADNCTIVLNKHMFNESDDAIKNTIYHELCHYVVFCLGYSDGIYVFDTNRGGWKYKDRYVKSTWGSHGPKWKSIAKLVGDAVGQEITRTNPYENHPGVKQEYDASIKYVVKCKHCGREFKYSKMSPFIKSIDANGHTTWYCKCPDGTKCNDFEWIKGKPNE